MKGALFIATLLVSFGLGACDKAEVADCRRACWNYNKVMFWAKVDEEAAKLSPEDAARLRAEREREYAEIEQRTEDQGHLNCITQCQHSLSTKQAQCLALAETPTALDECGATKSK